MADFSKQYCEKYDPDMPWDFDIEEEFDKLQKGHYISIICEGYGFVGLFKNKEGINICLFNDFDTDMLYQVPYSELTLTTHKDLIK